MADWTLSGSLFEERSRGKKSGYWAHKFRFRDRTLQVRLERTEQKSRQILVERINAKVAQLLAKEQPQSQYEIYTPKDHLADYLDALEAVDTTPKHLRQVKQRVTEIVDGAGFKKLEQISEKDFNRLLSVTRSSEVLTYGLTGIDRFVLYQFANQTGLRASEIASLTPRSFDFERRQVTIHCTISKRRKYDQIPMSTGLTELMREYVSERHEQLPIWSGSWVDNAGRMLRVDLKAAEIPFENREGRLDFHSLSRHTYATRVATMDGVSAVVAQRLCRFSTPALLDRYAHVEDEQNRTVVDRLPEVVAL